MSSPKPAHQRILLKLSGEALMGDDAFGINRGTIVRIVEEVAEVTRLGVQLAVVTIAASISIYTFFFENPSLTALQGGSSYVFPKPTFFGVDIGSTGKGGLTDSPKFALFCLIVLAGLCVFVANIRRGSSGRRFLAVRANERAAASAVIDVPRTKFLAFGLAARRHLAATTKGAHARQ